MFDETGMITAFGNAAGAATGGIPWGSLAQGFLGFMGNEETNSANAQMAQNQMDFQERMSNTAHQREVKDLIAAGINPMMTAMKGGASTPTGAMATMTNSAAAGMTSAAQAASIEQVKAMTDQAKAQTELIRSQVPEAAQRIATGASSAGHLDAQAKNVNTRLQAFADEWENIKAELGAIRAREQKDKDQAFQARQTGEQQSSFGLQARTHSALDVQRRRNLEFELKEKLPAEAQKLRHEAALLGLKMPEALEEAKFWGGADARTGIYFRHAPKNLTSALMGSMGAAIDDVRQGTNWLKGPNPRLPRKGFDLK